MAEPSLGAVSAHDQRVQPNFDNFLNDLPADTGSEAEPFRLSASPRLALAGSPEIVSDTHGTCRRSRNLVIDAVVIWEATPAGLPCIKIGNLVELAGDCGKIQD